LVVFGSPVGEYICIQTNPAVSQDPNNAFYWTAIALSGGPGVTGATGATGSPGPVINTNTTYYIATTGSDSTGDGSSGNPWASISKSLSYLADFWITTAATVTIKLADGSYTTAVVVAHPCGAQINIVGTNTYAKSISSIQSSSGGVGAWSYVVNLNNVTNIAVNDYVLIATASGGTNPLLIVGCHKITNVDGGNSQITFTSKSQYSSAAAGAVTATVTVVKTFLSVAASATGITVSGNYSLGLVDKLVLVGANVTNSDGLAAIYGGSITLGTTIGADNCLIGAYAGYNGILIPGNVIVSGGSYGLLSLEGGVIDGQTAVVACGALQGFTCIRSASFNVASPLACGCTTYGLLCQINSMMYVTTPTSVGTPTGVYASQVGYVGVVTSMTWLLGTTQYNPTKNTARTSVLNDFARIDAP
jgi:hypothetical protein